MRIDNLRNPHNLSVSSLDVELYVTDLYTFVIITDQDNPGMSITNGAEFFCPQIAARLDLNWSRCIFIESYPESSVKHVRDATYDRIKLAKTAPRAQYFPTCKKEFPVAEFEGKGTGWSPLPRELAENLQRAGLNMSKHLGKVGLFELYDSGDYVQHRIEAYDGNRYYIDHSENFVRGKLIGIVK